ncbi:hypothetical protein [Microbacterium sp. 179-I 3D3 NHS]|uniref:hypothetical protein n=1 Tax=Microbacterium sp. 179-I 3D3 NHS TaxID=3142382 RepID=UPI0039A2E95F
MSDAVPVDVFRFVAVRPPQLAAEPSPLADERPPEREGGERPARLLHRDLEGSRVRAQEILDAVDRGRFDPYVRAHARLLRLFGVGEPPDDARIDEVLTSSGLAELSAAQMRRAEDDGWTAYYCCCALGATHAQRAEEPLAALRVLRFLRRRGDGRLGDPVAILTAAAEVPEEFLPFAEAEERSVRDDEPDVSKKQVRRVLRDIGTASRLRTRLAEASEMSHAVAAEAAGSDHEVSVRLATGGSRLFADLPGDLSTAEHRIVADLDLAPRSLTNAVTTLDDHLAVLTERVSEWSGLAATRSVVAGAISGVEKGIDLTWIPPFLLGEPDPGTSEDEEVSGRIRVLGVGDLKVVKQTLLRYQPGEVAHIENVMAKETRGREHRVLDRSEDTLFTAVDTGETTERDTQSTERFELTRESEKTIQEDMSVEAGVTVSATYGLVSMTAHGDFAYATSKQESEQVSSTVAKEIVDRSRSRIEKRTRSERTTKTTHEVEETNTHRFSNDDPTHVVGIYRWVDKLYSAQIHNYGVRMMLEFIVPEPAAYYKASLTRKAGLPAGVVPPPPLVNTQKKALRISDITEDGFREYVARYDVAGVAAPPAKTVHAGISMAKDGIGLGVTHSDKPKEFLVPAGYVLKDWVVNASLIVRNHPKFFLHLAGEKFALINQPHPDAPDGKEWTASSPDPVSEVGEGVVPLSVVSYDVLAYALNISASCERTDGAFAAWQADTFQKISAAYEAKRKEYDAAVALIEAREPDSFAGANPLANREIQRNELKKLCLTLLTGQHFSSFDAMTNPPDVPAHIPEVRIGRALDIGPVIQFFEQAFEWAQMTYLYFPYFWGGKKRWVETSTASDPDPEMQSFLQAGSARVVLPVSPAYAASISYFLACPPMALSKKLWDGGTPPDIKDPLYRSIAEEVRGRTDDLQNATPEGAPWQFTLPTTLVWLQADSVLPEF